jgi:SAM-dependent methyltransferase
VVSDWWTTFFDADYLAIWAHLRPSERTEAEADGLASLLDLQPGDRVLDAPCGYGRLSPAIQRRGARVLGVDYSETMLAQAEATRSGEVRYLRHDLREPLSETGFDSAFNVFSSIGYAGEEADRRVLANTARALRPGGRFVLETMHRDAVVRTIARGGPPGLVMPDGGLVAEKLSFDPVAGTVETTWHWAGPRGQGKKAASFRVYCVTELCALLCGAGFRVISAHEGLTVRSGESLPAPFTDASTRIALLAERE